MNQLPLLLYIGARRSAKDAPRPLRSIRHCKTSSPQTAPWTNSRRRFNTASTRRHGNSHWRAIRSALWFEGWWSVVL